MSDFFQKFVEIEKSISDARGPFTFFALLLREEAQDKWDLVVAAPWIDENLQDGLDYIAARVQRSFDDGELIRLSRIVCLPQNDPALSASTRAIKVRHGAINIQDTNFFGVPVKSAYLITSAAASPIPVAPESQ